MSAPRNRQPLPLAPVSDAPATPLCPACGLENGVVLKPADPPLARSMASRVLCDACFRNQLRREELADEHERRRVHRIRINETLPRHLRDVRSKNSPAPREAVNAAKSWIDHGGGLMFTGPVGTGKTHLAAAAVRVALAYQPIIWQSVPSMIASATAAFDDQQRRHALAAITGTTALVLDDIDKVKPSDWAATQIFAAIDNRVTAGARLLVTGNKTPAQLASFFGGDIGPALAGRLVEYCRIVTWNVPDLRLMKGGKS